MEINEELAKLRAKNAGIQEKIFGNVALKEIIKQKNSIKGILGTISGALLPLWFPGNTDMGSKLIVSVFAASIIGGLGNIYGAVVGGFIIGFAELLGTNWLATQVGPWVIPYRPIIPLIAIAITLLLAPKGLFGVDWRFKLSKIVKITRSLLQRRSAASAT